MDDPEKPLLAEAIGQEMSQRGLSQITETSRVIGVGKRDLRKVLKGERRPNQRTWIKYARFLGVSVEAVHTMVENQAEREAGIYFSDEVDMAVRAIQDAAIQRVVGQIRPDLISLLARMHPTRQVSVLTFAQGLGKTPAKGKGKAVSGSAKSAGKTGPHTKHAITSSKTKTAKRATSRSR